MSDRLQPPSKRGGVGSALEGPREVGTDADVFPSRPVYDLRAAAAGSAGLVVSARSLFGDTRPCLAAWMTETETNGRARITASLTLFTEDGKVKAALADRDGGYVLFRSAETTEGLLDALEEALSSGKADWRASKRK